MLPVLSLMKATAPTWVEWLGELGAGSCARAAVQLFRHDGEPVAFTVVIASTWDEGPRLTVREDVAAAKLPLGCPERHINGDGTFCMGRGAGFVKWPRCGAEAEVWWENLKGFLGLQLIAASARRWPKGYGWRHGAAAAIEERLEIREAQLPRGVVEVARSAARGIPPPRGRRPCPCGSGRRFDRCHIRDVAALLELRGRMLLAERQYVIAWDRPCCGTMKDCPVRRARKTGPYRVSSPLILLLCPKDDWNPPSRAGGRSDGKGMRLFALPLRTLRPRPARQISKANPGPNRAARRACAR